MEGKSLIVYYSWVGNTEVIAKEIQKQTGYTLQRLNEVMERKPNKIGGAAMSAIFGAKSRLKPLEFSLEDFQNIFLGVQIWAGKTTPAINTFLSKSQLKEKKVWIFITKGSEKNPEKFIASITARVEKKGGKVQDTISFTTKWEPGKDTVISSDVIKEPISNWLKKIK